MSATILPGLSGKTIVVTGAAGDIGSALTASLLHAGARVAALDRSEEALARLGRRDALVSMTTDVTDEGSVARAFAAVAQRFGTIDGLVNGAGIEGARTPIDHYPATVFASVLAVNVTGVFLCTRAAMPLLRERGGAIVNLASTAGLKGSPGLAGYVASKHAVIGLTRVTALDGAPDHVRANAVCPSAVEGRMIEAIYAAHPGSAAVDAEARRRANPSGRYAEPEDVVALVGFLLSDAARFVTGACYTVDGGATA